MLSIPKYILVQDVTEKNVVSSTIPKFNKYTYVVFKEDIRNVYLIFFCVTLYNSSKNKYEYSNYISMLVSTSFDNSKYIWYNEGIITYRKTYANRTDYNYSGNYEPTINYFQSFPIPSLYKIDTLVCNYDEDNDNIMISGIRHYEVPYEQFTDVHSETYNICFGEVTKFLEYEGGFFYGGDYYINLELFHRVLNNYNTDICRYYYSSVVISEGSPIADYERHYKKRKIGYINRICWDDDVQSGTGVSEGIFYFNLLVSVDSAELRSKRKLSEIYGPEEGKLKDKEGVLDNSNSANIIKLSDATIDVEIRNIWAVTTNISYYMDMHTTFEYEYNKLPTFWTEVTKSKLDLGHTVGTLSKISLLMPLHFYIRRDPLEVQVYSHAGEAKGIKYVNMLYMSTNSIEKESFPTPEFLYNCFNSGHRRNKGGYNGVAIKINK